MLRCHKRLLKRIGNNILVGPRKLTKIIEALHLYSFLCNFQSDYIIVSAFSLFEERDVLGDRYGGRSLLESFGQRAEGHRLLAIGSAQRPSQHERYSPHIYGEHISQVSKRWQCSEKMCARSPMAPETAGAPEGTPTSVCARIIFTHCPHLLNPKPKECISLPQKGSC